MKNLSLNDVKQIQDDLIELLSNIVPINKWKHQVNSMVQIGTYKSAFAKAHAETNGDNYISIHPVLLQVRFSNKLKASIVHELTHFVLGFDENHNKKFRQVESYLLDAAKCDIGLVKSETETILSVIDYKWTVIAHLVDGTELNLGGVHKKTKKYSEYPRTAGDTHSVSDGEHRGKKVVKYEFIQNK